MTIRAVSFGCTTRSAIGRPAFVNRTVDERGARGYTIYMTRRRPSRDATIAVAYLRVSTEDQTLGVDAQRAAIEAYAARAGVHIVAWCEDRGVSGAAPLERRPGLLCALDAVRDAGAGTLIVARRDRLARDVVAAALIDRLVTRDGARVVSAAGEGTDGDDPASQLMRTLIDAFAAYERAIIRARTRAALGAKRARGERVGTVPYGYCVADEGVRLLPDAGEQAVIARVRAALAEGTTYRALAAELAAAGVRGRTGRPLGLAQLAAIARTPDA